jgi:peroxiredoxin Q/BCP
MPLTPGAKAPPFTLPAHDGSSVSLGDFKGKRVVIYFYPKDMTSGCTVEACEFRDNWDAVKKTGAVLLGVSPDGPESHERFRKKHDLPFPLLADEHHAVAGAYGAWGKKSMYGRTYMGILRTTFIIGGTGRITHVFGKVKPRGHAAEVLAALSE